jgi:copper chaperone
MTKLILNVDGMSCEHCVKAVTGAVSALPGVAGVYVDLKAKTVTVEHDAEKINADNIKSAIDGQGYDVM